MGGGEELVFHHRQFKRFSYPKFVHNKLTFTDLLSTYFVPGTHGGPARFTHNTLLNLHSKLSPISTLIFQIKKLRHRLQLGTTCPST